MTTPTKPWWEDHLESIMIPFIAKLKLVDNADEAWMATSAMNHASYDWEKIKLFITSVESRARETAIRECAEVARNHPHHSEDATAEEIASSILNLNNTK